MDGFELTYSETHEFGYSKEIHVSIYHEIHETHKFNEIHKSIISLKIHEIRETYTMQFLHSSLTRLVIRCKDAIRLIITHVILVILLINTNIT